MSNFHDGPRARFEARRKHMASNATCLRHILTGTFSALCEARKEEIETNEKGEDTEAARYHLRYRRDPESYLQRELGLTRTDPDYVAMLQTMDDRRPITRLSLDNANCFRVAAASVMWFYKTHEFAQVYVRVTQPPIARQFWLALKEIGLLNDSRPVAEEKAVLMGRIHPRFIQRRSTAFITSFLPRKEFGPNMMFVFGPETDWMHDRAKKVYLVGHKHWGRDIKG